MKVATLGLDKELRFEKIIKLKRTYNKYTNHVYKIKIHRILVEIKISKLH